MTFRLPTVQEEVVGWWEAPMDICSLGQQDFLPDCDFHGARELRETHKEETLVLARALQPYVKRSGAPPGVLCSIVRDLQRSMESLMVMTSWKPPYLMLYKMSQDHPQPQQKRLHSWARIPPQRGSGDHNTPSWPPSRDPQAQSHNQSSRPPGYSVTITIATTRVQTTHPNIWPNTPGRCRSPGSPPWRSSVGYNLPGLPGDGNSQECPNGQIWMPLQNMTHLNDIPVAEPIWGQGPAWCWLGTNGPSEYLLKEPTAKLLIEQVTCS